MIRIGEIVDKVKGYLPNADVALIQKAYVFSAAAHSGQTRLSGAPYLSHPLEVADHLADMRLDEAAIAAGLLHDTVEDTIATIAELTTQFGGEVAEIVDGVTKISRIKFDSQEEAQAENFRKMILAMAEDIRVLIVKLSDRLHNMRTLDHMSAPKQQRISQETLEIYAPLANRMGLHRLKMELEDLSLKYLKPDVYAQLLDGLKNLKTAGVEYKEYVGKVTGVIEDMLKKHRIKGRVSGRTKHFFSIHTKMVQESLPLEQVYDLIAFRIVVPGVKDCYACLGMVHAMWRPVPGRFKDYISMPKANMYQSLHSTVFGPDGERIEIQIRTEEMHRLAEYGVAAHWIYKEGAKVRDKEAHQFAWLRQILDWQKQESDSREFMRSLRFELFKEEVYVFTPKGQVRELPEGATPVDFAYMIHTEVGDRCSGGKVNGRLVPLSTKLQNGDTVEIITDPHRNPSRDWLKFVKSAKARTRIQHYLRTEERDRSIALGREMLEKEGRKVGINVAKALKEDLFEKVAGEFSCKSVEELISMVGYARLTPRKVLNRLLPKEPEHVEPVDAVPDVKDAKEEASRVAAAEGVRIQGVDNVFVRFARCCSPLPGDSILGYISRGRGVTVHRADCLNVGGMEPERMISVSWDAHSDEPYQAKIRLMCKNVRGVLATISGLLAKEKVNIDSGTFHTNVEGKTELIFTVEVRDAGHIYRTIEKLSKLDVVLEVIRLTTATG
jgi:GTP diphosphokinase / guanosine-3',5'-bis(diphosphate) 3'-diphosphatase